MKPVFETEYARILEKLKYIDPIQYGKSRNFVDGAVTYLSPYISRGVISTKQVLRYVLDRGYKIHEIESFVKELCWRDYFQRVAQVKNVNSEIKQPQAPVSNKEIPVHVVEAATGIEGIDIAIRGLYDTGYMHNHCRMYTASLVCNVAKSHWLLPAQWMYYHLLDGDWASNSCSWQWVAGANSSKKYFADQQNINKYTGTFQTGTFLDRPYEDLETMPVPEHLKKTQKVDLSTFLPESTVLSFNPDGPVFIYNYYNLDPAWHQNEAGNRILFLDPDFFSNYPVSPACIKFMLALSKNIPGIQIFTGSMADFTSKYNPAAVFYKEHPLNNGYRGNEEPREWIAEQVSGYFPSFFAYWKQVEKQLLKNTPRDITN